MTSMHDALAEALEHPRVYHPPHPKPLAKKIYRQSDVAESWLWTAIGACTGLALMLYALDRSRNA
jgi:hypothetical protein